MAGHKRVDGVISGSGGLRPGSATAGARDAKRSNYSPGHSCPYRATYSDNPYCTNF